MSTGVCVQIGLHKTTEYLYLVNPIFQESKQPPAVPEPLKKFDKWIYYGIDVDPCSICEMLNRYPKHPDIHWIAAGISASTKVLKYNSWYIGESRNHPPFHAAALTFDSLIDGLQLQKIDVLAIDIEGTELELFENYSWRIKPQFIAVESHKEQHDTLISMICSKGYKNIVNKGTNYRDGKYYTRELQFTL